MKKFSMKKVAAVIMMCVGVMGLQVSTQAETLGYTEQNAIVSVGPFITTSGLQSSINYSMKVERGTSFSDVEKQLPSKVQVRYTSGFDGATTTADIYWDGSNFAPYSVCEQTVTGTLILNGLSNPNNYTVKATVKVLGRVMGFAMNGSPYVYQKGDKYMTNNITVAQGTDFDEFAPDTVSIYTEHGYDPSWVMTPVSFDESEYDGNTLGTYVLTGTFVMPDLCYNPEGYQPTLTVTVK